MRLSSLIIKNQESQEKVQKVKDWDFEIFVQVQIFMIIYPTLQDNFEHSTNPIEMLDG